MTYATRTGVAIGVDLGGTKLLGAVISADGSVITTAHDSVGDPDYRHIIGQIDEMIRAVDPGDAAPVGVAAAAFLDADRRQVRQAANLGWGQCPFAEDLEIATGRRVVLVNDADAAAWAEFRFGAGAAAATVLVVTLGTGVGGGLVQDGQLIVGASGLAAELGHLVVDPGGRPCPCGARGCLEQYASGRALARSARERLANGGKGALAEIDELTARDVTAAAEVGDALAREVCRDAGNALGHALAMAVTITDASVVVIGGGVSAAVEPILAAARPAFAAWLGVPDVRPPVTIVRSSLGAAAGAIGAAELALHAADDAR